MVSDSGILRYQIKANAIIVYCSGLDEDNQFNKNNNAIGELLNDFLLELSEGRKVFCYAYRLSKEDEKELICPDVILEKVQTLIEPFNNAFFYLKSAKIRSTYCGRACNTDIYYFDNAVEWTDFLASSVIRCPIKLIDKGVLSAMFSSCDHGSDFWLICSKAYESKVMNLIDRMSDLGYEVKRSYRLSYPYGE